MVKTAGLSASPTVLMTQNTALIAMGKIFAATPVDTWKAYLAFHFISDHAQYLPKAFDEANFDFFREDAARRAGAARALEARRRAAQRRARRGGRRDLRREVISRPRPSGRWTSSSRNLRGALRASASPTRPGWTRRPSKAALAKLAAFDPRIGYPVNCIDYSSIKVERTDLLGNAMARRRVPAAAPAPAPSEAGRPRRSGR